MLPLSSASEVVMSPLLSAMPVFTDPLVISPLISPLAIVWLKLLFNTNLLASITLLALAYEQVKDEFVVLLAAGL